VTVVFSVVYSLEMFLCANKQNNTTARTIVLSVFKDVLGTV